MNGSQYLDQRGAYPRNVATDVALGFQGLGRELRRRSCKKVWCARRAVRAKAKRDRFTRYARLGHSTCCRHVRTWLNLALLVYCYHS